MRCLRSAFWALLAVCLLAAPGHAQEAEECPYPKRWEPSTDELQIILQAHSDWWDATALNDPTIPGKANLCMADLIATDLSGANLHAANLHAANLREADLREADLSRADLSRADLREADLSGADLSGANLQNVNFTRTRLLNAIYQPVSAPAKGQLSGILDLVTVRFDPGGHSGLAQLRAARSGVG